MCKLLNGSITQFCNIGFVTMKYIKQKSWKLEYKVLSN